MSSDSWLVLVVLIAVVAVMVIGRGPVVAVMGGGVGVLLLTGAVDDRTALSGLSSPATATIAALYIVAGAVSTTGALAWPLDRALFGGRGGLARLAGATAAMSSFVPNTPLVALAAPRVVRWSRLTGASASRVLMPLSFASIFGGVITLLGTSTNLVVSDSLRQAGERPLGVFEVTPVGLPVAVVGIGLMVVLAPRLLRDRTPAPASMRATARSFQIQMTVEPDGPLAGLTIEQARLRHLEGTFLAAVERGGHLVAAHPDRRLNANDRLYFVGDVARVVDLHGIAGLVSAEHPHLIDTEGPGARLFEAVVAGGSDLAGSSLRTSGFRSRYDAAVLAVHRADDQLRGKLGTIPLRAGDVLLVLAGADFGERWRDHGDFALVASADEPPPPRRYRAWVAIGALAAVVVLAATGVTDLLSASVVGAGAVVIGRALTLSEARHAVDLGVVLTIAASISLGNAVSSSGLAGEIATHLVRLGEPLGDIGLLLVVIVATQLLTEVLSNGGAAALMVPVATSAAIAAGEDPRAFAVGVLIGASCSFLTPIGYQTNLMVFGLGGYRFTDYTRLGLPLTLSSALIASVALQLTL